MTYLIPLLIIAIILTVNWFAAKQFQEIAQMKGHPNSKYFWWCFWLGALGWAMVIALPDRGIASAETGTASDELPDL